MILVRFQHLINVNLNGAKLKKNNEQDVKGRQKSWGKLNLGAFAVNESQEDGEQWERITKRHKYYRRLSQSGVESGKHAELIIHNCKNLFYFVAMQRAM